MSYIREQLNFTLNKFDIEFENERIKFAYSFSIKKLRQNSKW